MNRIQQIRETLGVTQLGFARAVGVSQGTVSRWESGDIAVSTESWRSIKRAVLHARKPWRDSWVLGDEAA